MAPSEPGSPALSPMRADYGRRGSQPLASDMSTSTLNLNQAPQGRAPSAYLEDLFDARAGPSPDRR